MTGGMLEMDELVEVDRDSMVDFLLPCGDSCCLDTRGGGIVGPVNRLDMAWEIDQSRMG